MLTYSLPSLARVQTELLVPAELVAPAQALALLMRALEREVDLVAPTRALAQMPLQSSMLVEEMARDSVELRVLVELVACERT